MRLQEAISRNSFDTPLYHFTIPDVRAGMLDFLLALSNDLVKSNIFIEGVLHKIRRQIEDLERVGGVEPGTLTLDGVPVDSYLTSGIGRKIEAEMDIAKAKSKGYLWGNGTGDTGTEGSDRKKIFAVIGVYTGFGSRLKRNTFRGSWMPRDLLFVFIL
ncbi:hypothetical protein ZWY2020_040179 [Hordeum vulgare]|nr:hypothetical protein ZWY2020_040179 [Hordeum vulgare]